MHAAALSMEQVQHIEPLLVRYAMRAVRREDVAHDLVQETFAAAMTGLPQFEGRSTLRTWMVGILRRKIVDFRRRQKPTTSFEDDWHGARGDGSPDLSLDHSSAANAVLQHLDALPELERRAVHLCDVQDTARDEAAAQMQVSDGHLRVLLHRGRKRLRESLREAGFTQKSAL